MKYVVTDSIMEKKGKFNVVDIEYDLKMRGYQGKDISDYTKEKIEQLVDLGLVGKTEVYYYSIDKQEKERSS